MQLNVHSTIITYLCIYYFLKSFTIQSVVIIITVESLINYFAGARAGFFFLLLRIRTENGFKVANYVIRINISTLRGAQNKSPWDDRLALCRHMLLLEHMALPNIKLHPMSTSTSSYLPFEFETGSNLVYIGK